MGIKLNKPFILGIGFTFVIAVVSILLSNLPVFNKVGALAIAIITAILYRHFLGYPTKYESGVAFSTKKLLRLAIILYGLKLNLSTIINQGGTLLLLDVGVVAFAILFILFLNKFIKGDKDLVLLLGVGTGVCGAAAIAAISPILKSKESDVGISVGLVAIMGTIFSLVYSLLIVLFPMDPTHYGIWAGSSLHEIAHVVLAAGAGGSDALSIGLLTKLGRVFLLIPLSIIFLIIVNSRSSNKVSQKIDFPYFLIGFLIMSAVNTFITIPEGIMSVISTFTNLTLIMAMVGLGLNVSFGDLRTKAFKPMIAMAITSVVLSVITFFVVTILL
ncbi:YeiH family protein [Mammaliicoccus stepanovicii]|uniref:Membrane spanning protein n=1 Tax=Mammaliicoccus stepanovicii TaxID=643214 RepID=A0A240A6I6_9STAP|nr:putative sulfate exporter family transporter [Mammaliicoccus stepanovicii]PNZ78026.1 putative sulfate exporter family transporter [Mammaliicoccus stepanovicii]GGI39619.1 membrane protein [Mammaliicoccus stepanovicii]SNV79041.1 membrane spanning protein [Mammaliicoccus stepanovicii]